MPFLRPAALLLTAAFVSGCRIESHPPANLGSELDAAAVRSAVAAHYAQIDPLTRVVRSELHQEGILTTAWVATSPAFPEGAAERTELLVLRLEPAGWRVVFVGSPAGPRP
ncbi:MAG TPA: hypothetical protein VFO06_11080 [Gemmatimonadales bacterium]|jgi:hypothetical protein|nr:hypothetical protein [Gemmatimonadales bacterium]